MKGEKVERVARERMARRNERAHLSERGHTHTNERVRARK